MTQNQTSFQKGNEFWKMAQKAGRPELWTEADAHSLIIKLNEWKEKEDSICLAGFRADNGITMGVLKHLRTKFPEFSTAYEMTQAKVSSRLSSGLGKNVHQAVFNRYQSVYDGELKEHDKEMANIKATADEDAKKEMMKEGRETAEMIAAQRSNPST